MHLYNEIIKGAENSKQMWGKLFTQDAKDKFELLSIQVTQVTQV